jgi:NADPH:quinone reductase-like Zn-dependent oxidoreductase
LPPLVIPIPKGVKDEEAVALIGGGDVALTFLKLLRKSSPKQIIIYGANSVTGLILMQLLTNLTKLSIVPMTTKASQK